MQQLRVGVVGVGSLGQHHARVYASTPGVNLVGISDAVFERAQGVADKHSCRVFQDLDGLLKEVEAVSIAVPTEAHVEVGLRALDAGVHILVEKPIAPDVDGAQRLIDAARDRGLLLQVGHIERFNPVVQAVRGFVTRPQFFEAHRLGVFVPRSLDVDVILDLMVHDLDLVLWLVRLPVKEIRAVGIPVLTPRVDIANARIEFANGCVANLTASRVSREKVRKLRFFQPSEYVSLDFHSRSVEMFRLVSNGPNRSITELHPEVQDKEPLRLELEHFMGSVRGQSSEIACTGEEAREVVRVAREVVDTASRNLQLSAAGFQFPQPTER